MTTTRVHDHHFPTGTDGLPACGPTGAGGILRSARALISMA